MGETTVRMLAAVNGLLLDLLAAVARKDYTDRRRRRENADRNAAIVKLLQAGESWAGIQAATGCSRSTISRLRGRVLDANS